MIQEARSKQPGLVKTDSSFTKSVIKLLHLWSQEAGEARSKNGFKDRLDKLTEGSSLGRY